VDFGMWAYEHRGAILLSIIIYLLFGIAFVAADIVVERSQAQTVIALDFSELEQLQEELKRAQEINRELSRQVDASPVVNAISNEHGLNERLNDHRTDASSIYAEADAVQQRMRENASDYEMGLAAADEAGRRTEEKGGERKTSRVQGNVSVSYWLSEPVRHAVRLPVPAYMCEGGGEVVVNITVDPSGEVIDCSIDESYSENNSCLRRAALEKARVSKFNADSSAPARQQGTISYLFVPQ
jgi:TonB family protein